MNPTNPTNPNPELIDWLCEDEADRDPADPATVEAETAEAAALIYTEDWSIDGTIVVRRLGPATRVRVTRTTQRLAMRIEKASAT